MTAATRARIVLMAFAAACAVMLVRPAATVDAAVPPRVLIIGDSIVQYYSDTPGDTFQGWWSQAVRGTGAQPITSAQGASGVLRRGLSCEGTTFSQRLKDIDYYDPDVIVVAGGFNDRSVCVNDRYVTTADHYLVSGTQAYIQKVFDKAKALGISPKRVLWLNPWGSSHYAERTRIGGIWSSKVRELGMVYIPTHYLHPDETIDNTHPNRAGNTYLAGKLKDALELALQAP